MFWVFAQPACNPGRLAELALPHRFDIGREPARELVAQLHPKLHICEAGTEVEVGAGDAYVIEPGHDAWVVGDEPLVGYEFESTTAATPRIRPTTGAHCTETSSPRSRRPSTSTIGARPKPRARPVTRVSQDCRSR